MTTKKPQRRVNLMENMGLAHIPGVEPSSSEASVDQEAMEVLVTELPTVELPVHFTPSELRVIGQALELYARLGMGQLDSLTTMAREGLIPMSDSIPNDMKSPTLLCFDQLMDEARINMGFETFADMSIFSKEVHDDCKLAWDLHRSIQEPGNCDEKAYTAGRPE